MGRRKKGQPYAERKPVTPPPPEPAVTVAITATFTRRELVLLLCSWYIDVNYQSFFPLDRLAVAGAVNESVTTIGLPDTAWEERHGVDETSAKQITAWAEAAVDEAWPELALSQGDASTVPEGEVDE